MPGNVDAVRKLLAAVEKRDLHAVLDCYHDNVEINESSALPYGGVYRGHRGVIEHAIGFIETWGSYQTRAEYTLDPTFLESDDGTVVALFRHRAVDPISERRLDMAEIGVYRVCDGKVVRTQMFHFDTAAIGTFLKQATAAAAHA